MYSQTAIVVNEFLGKKWRHVCSLSYWSVNCNFRCWLGPIADILEFSSS